MELLVGDINSKLVKSVVFHKGLESRDIQNPKPLLITPKIRLKVKPSYSNGISEFIHVKTYKTMRFNESLILVRLTIQSTK